MGFDDYLIYSMIDLEIANRTDEKYKPICKVDFKANNFTAEDMNWDREADIPLLFWPMPLLRGFRISAKAEDTHPEG